MLSVAWREPPTVGWNVMATTQLAPPASVAPQVPGVSAKSAMAAPVTDTRGLANVNTDGC